MILRPEECEAEEEEEDVFSESALPSASWSHVSIVNRWSQRKAVLH
jgi:hypothetical protein